MLAALWAVPLFGRTLAHYALIPLGVPAMLFAFALILRRVCAEGGGFVRWPRAGLQDSFLLPISRGEGAQAGNEARRA